MSKFLKGWLKIWIHVISFFVGGIVFYMFINWGSIPWQQKTLGFFLLVFLLHIIEEGDLPGGFYYMYNTVFNPDNQLFDRYPINRKSEMIENFLGITVTMIYFWFFPNNKTVIACLMICIVEVPGHLMTGKKMKEHLKGKGKRTWYNPGLATTLLGFLPTAIYMVVMIAMNGASLLDFVFGILLGIVSMQLCIKLPDKVFMDKNSPYVYTEGYGYFDKFLSKNSSD